MAQSTCIVFYSALILCLIGLGSGSVRADDIHLTASGGLGGWYRPGGWNPISVTVQNSSDETVTGQLQVELGSHSVGSSSDEGYSLDARPVTVSANSSQNATVYIHGVDPVRDSLKVIFVEGNDRGDGRVLAQLGNDPTNSNPTNSNFALTSMPLGDNDLLLAGFTGSPGAFQSLSAQMAGSKHQGTGKSSAPVVQIASLVAADLPDQAAGYSAVNALLLRGDSPVDSLSEMQSSAIKGWVASGGALMIFCTGADPNVFASSFYQDLLPVTIGPPDPNGRLRLFPRAIPGVQIVQRSPTIITSPYGNGWITVTNFDPWSASASPNSIAVTTLWRNLLAEPSTYQFLSQMVQNDEKSNLYFWASNQPDISHAVKPSDDAQTYVTEMIGVFLMIYLLVVLLGSYLIIRKTGRKQLVWVIIPLGTLLFSGATFGIGYAANGGTVFVNRAAVIETNSGQRKAGIYAALGLYSPSRASYDLNVPGENSVVALPVGDNQVPKSNLIKFVQRSLRTDILDLPVNMGETRPLEMESTIDLGGPISYNINRSGSAGGVITNHSNFDLTDCQVYSRGQWQPVGTLKQGGSIMVSSAGRAANPASAYEIPQTSNISPADKLLYPSHRVRFELDNYLWSVGQQYTTSRTDSILFGWCDNPTLPGPPVKIDGRSVVENNVSLVIVHLTPSGK